MIASGGYGCVYRPEITKHGKQTKNEKIVSKIQLNNFSSKNEMEISEVLKELKNADDYFGLIENMSNINIISGIDAVGISLETFVLEENFISRFPQ